MKTLVDKYADLSKEIYNLCSKKELIRRKCLNLGRMECDLLNFISTVEKPICMNDLSEEMQVSHSRITRIIDTLVRKFEWPVIQIVKQFGKENVSRVVLDAYEKAGFRLIEKNALKDCPSVTRKR